MPMGPAPRIRTVESGVKGLVFTACQPTARGSTRANSGIRSQLVVGPVWGARYNSRQPFAGELNVPPISKETLSGSRYSVELGTTMCSANPPPQPTIH